MLCVLFKSYLILAVPDSDFRRYQIVTCAGLRDFRVESTENGKGVGFWISLFALAENMNRLTVQYCALLVEDCLRIRTATLRGDFERLLCAGGGGMENTPSRLVDCGGSQKG